MSQEDSQEGTRLVVELDAEDTQAFDLIRSTLKLTRSDTIRLLIRHRAAELQQTQATSAA